jgi:hypothetical protein
MISGEINILEENKFLKNKLEKAKGIAMTKIQ